MSGLTKQLSIAAKLPKKFQTIDSSDLAALIQQKAPMVVLDLRDADHTGGHVPGALRISYADFEQRIGELVGKFAKSERVVFYCMFGQMRSPAAAQEFLNRVGSDKADSVLVLDGGFHDYVKRFHADSALVDGFDKSQWTDEWLHVSDLGATSYRNK